MASEELRRSRLQRAKDFAVRARSRSRDNISTEELAAIKKKADDLDAIQQSVSDAAALGAPLWLSYIFLLFYIAIAAGAVTHKELLLESPVDLPFLNIKLPLKAFFIVAPILFLIVHAYVLAHFAMLSDKAKAFHGRLTAKITAEIENDHAIREGLRQQLPINVFVQFLAGPTDIRESAFGVLLWVIAWTTLVGAPVLVLLLLQLQFLPYHDTRVTWLHRGVLCVDLVVIWWLWMKILAGRDRSMPRHLDRWMRGWDDFLRFFRNFGAQFATASIATFSVLIATFPDEWEDWPFRLPQRLENRIATATQSVFGKVDALDRDTNKGVTGYWPVNTLRLREFDIYAALGVEGKVKLNWKPYSFSLKDRRLEHADLRDARLDNIDLRGVRLDGGLLDGAKLEGANAKEVWLQSASLVGAHLQGASLNKGHFRGSSLTAAQLQGAVLDEAELQGGLLDEAQLQGASLAGAQLQGASLTMAKLQGASLDMAELSGASLNMAELSGASLARAKLWGASLWRADLRGASLDMAELRGASLNAAQLQGALLDGTQLQAASLKSAYLWRADWGELELLAINPIRFDKPKWGAMNSRLDGGEWQDESWTDRAYDELHQTMEALPRGALRDHALARIARLSCKSSGVDIAPCKANPKPLRKAQKWREVLEAARADDEIYEPELANILRGLICGNEANAIDMLRQVASNGQLGAVGSKLRPLIDDIIQGNYCPVASELTDADKARLWEIKAVAETEFYPPFVPSPELETSTTSPSAPPAKAPTKGDGRLQPRVPAPP
jgi:uncharacterized protein YjbI with pentapeptide repeats